MLAYVCMHMLACAPCMHGYTMCAPRMVYMHQTVHHACVPCGDIHIHHVNVHVLHAYVHEQMHVHHVQVHHRCNEHSAPSVLHMLTCAPCICTMHAIRPGCTCIVHINVTCMPCTCIIMVHMHATHAWCMCMVC